VSTTKAVPRPVQQLRGAPHRRSGVLKWTTDALRDLVYDGAVLGWSIVAFTVLITGISVTASLLVFVVGVFAWIGFVFVMRWTTVVDRRLAGWQRDESVAAVYRRQAEPGFMPLLKTVSSDPQTWKDMSWLALTSIVGFTFGIAVVAAAGLALAYVSMPAWYWAISDAGAEDGLTNLGFVTVDTFGEAVAVSGIGLALVPPALLLARVCASAHASLAARLLTPSRPVGQPRTANPTARAARWSAAHRKIAVFGWVAFVMAAFAIGNAAGTVTLQSQELGTGESHTADRILAQQFPDERAAEQVLIQSRTARLGGPEYRATVADLVTRLARVKAVTNVRSPLSKRNSALLSNDGRSALLTFQISGNPDTADERVGSALAATAAVQAAHPRLSVGEVGRTSAIKAIDRRTAEDFDKAAIISLPVTLVILLLAFGSLVAAGIPLLLGMTSVMAALGLTAAFSHVMHVDQSIGAVILLVGLAVGVDYSLFYLRREREERARGLTAADALQTAAATAGRAVLVSGLTVIVAMSGMLLMGSITFISFGVGTALVVAIALVGSLTVLPALLAMLGDKVDRGRVPLIGRLRGKPGDSRFWGAIVGAVLRRPVISAGVATALLVALAIPAFSLHTINAGVQGMPRDLPVMQVYDRVQEAFPGGPQPAQVVVSAPDVTAAPVAAGIRELTRAAVATGQMHEPITVDISASRHAARIMVPLAGTTTDAASDRALDTLRHRVIPRTIGSVPGVQANVTGETAESRDFNDSMKAHAPLVFGFVLGLAFLLLLVTFRSVVIPLTAIALNLLSVGAAYGVLVLVFQRGNLESLLDFKSIGGVTSWLPLFLFVILFGLSMDYHVLILSRVREAYDSGMTTDRAVAHGIRATAGVVTSAAFVMVGVFAIFTTLSMLDMKMMGVGLAVAVLLDATIVRAVLLPATMKLLGDWNWYLPSWLEWLPRVGARGPAVGATDA
jgi:uncharacterized membrane protein YdfJ with MMPL/SSD domain